VCLLIGEYLRDPGVPSRADGPRVVHLLEPTLETWGVPFHRLEQPDDLDLVEVACREARERGGPVAVLVGAVTGAA
jgi:hypothetical protein